MAQIDLTKEMKHLYSPAKDKFTLVDVPGMNFLMLDGVGDPNKAVAYAEALNALYAMAYSLKFSLKKQGLDYRVMPLEGLWYMEDMRLFDVAHKSEWLWTMMILQPEAVTAELVDHMREEVARKKSLPALPKLRFGAYNEGLAVQTLYFGAYADEGPTIARMHAFITSQGYALRGKHHEIYLGDPRKSAPEKLKTIIRQPVSRPG